MSRKKNRLMILTLVLSACFLLGFAFTAKGASITMTLAHDDVAGGAEDLAMIKFGEVVQKLTRGEIKYKVLPGRAMGDEKEILQAIKTGAIQGSNITTGQLSNWVPIMGVCDMPYAFVSEEHAQRCLNGPIGRSFGKKAEEKGFAVFGYYYQGFRNISGKRPITTLEDMKGLKMRTTPSPTHLKGYKALGINTTPIPGGECYVALKTGLVEASEQPFTYWYENNYWELSKHYNFTRTFNCTCAIIVAHDWYETLTPKQQLAIKVAGVESGRVYMIHRDEHLKKYYKEAQAKGVVFHEVDVKPLAKATAQARRELAEEFGGKEGLEVLDLIELVATID